MKAHIARAVATLLPIAMLVTGRTPAPAGPPEQPVTLAGVVTNTATGERLTSGEITVSYVRQTGGPAIVLRVPLGDLAGGCSYALQLPCVSVLSAVPEPTPANTLALATTPTGYNRSATVQVGGRSYPATILGATSVTVGLADRGRVQRLDLEVSIVRDSGAIVNYLLGLASDPTGMDLNTNGRVEVGDVITSVNAAPAPPGSVVPDATDDYSPTGLPVAPLPDSTNE